MPLHRLATSCAVVVFAHLANAQEPTTTAAPAPHVLIDALGPNAWLLRFAPTNLGSMLESERGRALWQPRLLPLLDGWRQLVGDDDAFREQRARVLGYGGRVRVALSLVAGQRDPQFTVAVRCDGDGHTDLAQLATDLGVLLTRATPGAWNDRDLGGRTIAVRELPNVVLTQPLVDQGGIVFAAAAAPQLNATMAAAFAMPPGEPLTTRQLFTRPPLQVHFDLAGLLATTLAEEPDVDQRIFRALGCDSLGTLDLALATAGPRIAFEAALHFAKPDHGVFAGPFPATASLPELPLALPKATGTWRHGHFDFKACYEAIEQAIAAWNQEEPEKVRAKATKELGCDPITDLLDHATDEVLFSMSPLGDGEPREAMEALDWTLVVRLRDEAKFAKSFDMVVAESRPFLDKAGEEEHAGIKLLRFGNMFAYDLWYGIGNGVLLLGGGPTALDRLSAQIDALAAAKQAPAKAPETPATFQELRKFLPAGGNGFATSELETLVVAPESLLGAFLVMYGFGRANAEDTSSADLLALLRENNLGTVRTASGYADATWRWHLYW